MPGCSSFFELIEGRLISEIIAEDQRELEHNSSPTANPFDGALRVHGLWPILSLP